MKNKEFYYCKGLSGESTYHTCINADLSISCNCNDYDGHGQIGNLNIDSFEDIWKNSNKTAQKFRDELSNGNLPISNCGWCPARVVVNEQVSQEKRLKSDFPKGIMIENSVACNYKCVGCDPARKRLFLARNKFKMSLDDVTKVSETCKSIGINHIYYHNLSEPFSSNTILEELQLIRTYLPSVFISVSTNAGLINTDEKRKAALLMDEVYCSIDGGSQESAQIYQVNIKFSEVIENVKNLIKLRNQNNSNTKIIWKYVTFPWNDSEIEIKKAISIAKEIECDNIYFNVGVCGSNPSEFYKQDFFKDLQPKHIGEYYIISFK